MNAIAMARTAYTSTAEPIRTERGIEYDAFARITRQLKTSDPASDYPAYVQALHDNRRLWNVLATSVADPDNELPRDLRARIFYLAEFTAHQTAKILSEGASAASLIDVNTTVMKGLLHQGGAA